MKQTAKITVLAEITILPGYENEIRVAAEKIWIATRKEDGCELFIFNEKKEEPTIVFFEVFKSVEDFEYHVQAEHTKNFLSCLENKVIGNAPKLTFLNQFE